MKIRNLMLLITIAFTNAYSQSEVDMAAVQKSVKSDLTKHAPAATSVSFEGCKMQLKLTSGEYVTVLKDVTGTKERELNPMKQPITTDRPGDEAARNLSSGAGDDYSTIRSDTFSINLAAINGDGIVAGTQRSGKMIQFSLISSREAVAISRKVDGKLIAIPTLTFNIKDEAGARVADGLKKIVSACAAQK